MDIVRAFTYVFEDKDWVAKIAVLIMLSLASALFPVGLVALVAVLGYMLETAANVRNNLGISLAVWDNFPEKMTSGTNILVAAFVYNIPTLVLGGWGGSLCGLSSLDYMDASENQTTTFVSFLLRPVF